MKRTALLFVCFTYALFTSCQSDVSVVSKEEALAAAKKMETIIKNRDTEAYNAFFDEPYLLKILEEKSRVLKDRAFMKGFKSSFSFRKIAETVTKDVQNGGGYTFLRNYEKDGRQHILFRALSSNGLNYLDFHLLKVKNKVKAVDVMSYITGEDMTSTMADAIDAMGPQIEEKGNSIPAALDSVRMMKKCKDEGDYPRVKAIYEWLPVKMQETKGFLMLYIAACKGIGDSTYAMSLEKMAKIFPATPSSYLMMIDAYTYSKEYDKVLMAIDKVDSFTGGDPFLDYYRGNIYWIMDKKDKALELFEKAYAYDPGQILSVEVLISVYLQKNEIEKAKEIAAAYKTSKNFSQQYMDLLNANYPALLN